MTKKLGLIIRFGGFWIFLIFDKLRVIKWVEVVGWEETVGEAKDYHVREVRLRWWVLLAVAMASDRGEIVGKEKWRSGMGSVVCGVYEVGVCDLCVCVWQRKRWAVATSDGGNAVEVRSKGRETREGRDLWCSIENRGRKRNNEGESIEKWGRGLRNLARKFRAETRETTTADA